MHLSSSEQWASRDLQVLWHPCTQMQDHEAFPPVTIQRGDGVWLEDHAGKRYLDAISSWWVNLFGHAHPHITQALSTQLQTLEHTLFAGFSHEPGILLAEQLVALTPEGLQRCFYADNGSSAIEVALKMSFHYWLNQTGTTRKQKFITLENSYHGETLGALAVGDVSLYRQTYQPLLMSSLTVPAPDRWQAAVLGVDEDTYVSQCAAKLEALLEVHAEEVCALILEPLLQCAGGMRMYPATYLVRARQLCDRYGIHLIADEIATGFGRTGTMFACEQANITPDFLCLSKGLTGGYLPLSAVLTRQSVYDAFYAEYTQMKAFLHSHSYTGNPLACRAALATLELFASGNTLSSNRELATHMSRAAEPFRHHPNVADVRQCGMVLAIELVQDRRSKQPFPWQERRGYRFYHAALKRGLLLRPLGHVIYFMPPYVITPDEIDWLFSEAFLALEEVIR